MELDREAAAALGISADVVARAASRRREGRTLAEALAEIGATGAATFGRALAEAAGLPFAAAPPALPARELTALLPMPFAKRHLVLPLARDGAGLAVALADPAALAALEDLRFLYRAPVRPLVVPAPALREAITRAYDAAARSAADTMDAIEDERLDLVASELDEPPDLLEAGDDTPVIRLVNALLAQAVKDGASDIHIEPHERGLAVRFRTDGLLHDVLAPPGRLAAAIAARVKIMAGLDIAERRLPQDGRLRVRVAGRDIDVRVSIVPTAFGERVALRLLDRASALLDLRELGLAPATAAALTGHLVFSPLHTTDAPGAMTRLVDMGVEPFLISSSVLAVLAQRLLRRVCDGCAVAGRPTADERRALGPATPEVLRRAGPGCAACRGTGYRGRSAIHELLVVDDPVRALVMVRADAAQVRRHATAAGMATLRDDGFAKARAGVTTVAEVLRVTQDEG